MPPNQTVPPQTTPPGPQPPNPKPIPSAQSQPIPSNLYPVININRNEKPNRFYAFPLIGFLTKIIILIPVFIWMAILGIVQGILLIINSFIVLFTGKYWK